MLAPSGGIGGGGSREVRGGGRARATIALVLPQMEEAYHAAVWPAVIDVAQEHDVNLLCFAGRQLRSPYGFDAQANVLYDLVSADIVDGLVLMTGSLGNFVGLEEVREFCERYRPLPMVSIALAVEGIPSIVVDNEKGMRDVVAHLVEFHGYGRIALIRGPEGHREADARYRAYAEFLAGRGLAIDPALVIPGDFSVGSGVAAIRLLEQHKVDYDVVVAANDAMATGALEELQSRQIRVPYDVAVVGFDDNPDARFVTPPLTTVRQPLYDQGRLAAEMLLDLLGGKSAPACTTLRTELVVRQSCGCPPEVAVAAAAGPVQAVEQTLDDFLAERREQLRAELVQVLGASGSQKGAIDPAWAERLLDAFVAELAGGVSGAFLPKLDEISRQLATAGGDVNLLHGVLSALRRQMLPGLVGQEFLSRAEDLWQQARALIGEMAQRVQAQQRLQMERKEQTLREISQTLTTTVDVPQLMDEVAQNLPRLGITRGAICLYEDSDQRATSRLVLAFQEGGRTELPPEGQVFPSRRLCPEGVLSQQRRHTMSLEPLYFRDMSIGFSLLEMGPRDGVLYWALGRQISSALKGALLSRERERLFDSLEHRALELQTAAEVARAASSILEPEEMIQQVVDLVGERFGLYYTALFLVDPSGKWVVLQAGTGEMGRQMVDRGHRLEIGGRSMIAWCVANKQPRIALDVGEDPLHLANPLLPETRSEMALPLKVGERVIGALDAQSQRVGAFSTDAVTVFQTMADQLAVAIENARVVAEMRQLNVDLHGTLETQERLLSTIRELSTPVVPLVRGIILLPLVGNIDTARSQQIMDQLLTGVQQHHAQAAIVDITGVPIVDTSVANSLIRAAQAVSLLGAEVVLVGIRPEVAQTMVTLGVDLSGVATHSNLQNGIEYTLWRLGFHIAAR